MILILLRLLTNYADCTAAVKDASHSSLGAKANLSFRLSDIFTRLRMVSREKTRGSVTDKMVDMSGIFQPHEECQNPKKVLIEGDPGMGKTTYCNKLAYDWASMQSEVSNCFPNFKMVLLLRCRDMTSDLNL